MLLLRRWLVLSLVVLTALSCAEGSAKGPCKSTGTSQLSKEADLKNAAKVTELATCADNCVECVSKSDGGIKIVEYYAQCGTRAKAVDALKSATSANEATVNANFKCSEIAYTGCTAAACYPELEKILKPSDDYTKCPLQMKRDTTTDSGDVFCHGKASTSNTPCGFGIGYDSDKAVHYMGCKAECDRLIGALKAKDNSATATCTTCATDAECKKNMAELVKNEATGSTTVKTPKSASETSKLPQSSTTKYGSCTKASMVVVSFTFFTAARMLFLAGPQL